MAILSRFHRFAAALLMAAAALLPARPALAEIADLAQVPLANSPSDAVLPNLMYILDDSGSMAWNYMPDNIYRTSSGDILKNCKRCTSASCSGPGGTGNNGFQCGNVGDPNTATTTAPADYGEAPFYATAFNKIWYNPDITYSPGVDYLGVSLGNANPNSAKDDYYLGGGSTNLVNGFPEVYYCNTNSPSGADLNNASKCRRNGIHNVAPFLAGQPTYFLYWNSTGTNIGLPTTTYFNKALVNTSNAHYFSITPHEYCSDANLVSCVLATAAGASPGSPNTIPAPLRYCKTAADATSTGVVSGNSGGNPRCQRNYDRTTPSRATAASRAPTSSPPRPRIRRARIRSGRTAPRRPRARTPRRSRTSPTGGRTTAPAWRS